jgi:hypothetical protein
VSQQPFEISDGPKSVMPKYYLTMPNLPMKPEKLQMPLMF